MKYRLIAADMDGTLLNDRLAISDANIQAIKRFRDNGGIFTIATGRLASNTKKYLAALGLDKTHVLMCCGVGGAIVDTATLECKKAYCLDNAVANGIVEDMRGRCEMIFVMTPDVRYGEKSMVNGFFKRFCEITDSNYGVVDDLCAFTKSKDNSIIKIIIAVSADCVDRYMSELKQKYPSVRIIRSTPPFLNTIPERTCPEITLIECVDMSASKGIALKYIADSYGIPMSEVIGIGDDFNDYELVQAAGLGVAMANARDKVKSVADYITDTNNADGVAKAVCKFCLNCDKED